MPDDLVQKVDSSYELRVAASSVETGLLGTSLKVEVDKAALPSPLKGFFMHPYHILLPPFEKMFTEVKSRKVKPYPTCRGETNEGNDVAILVSYWISPDSQESMKDSVDKSINGLVFGEYLKTQGSFMRHRVGNVKVIIAAKADDLLEAVVDPQVSSIVLMGHSSVQSWQATDRMVSSKDISDFVRQGRHCKNGFGLKTGCNIRWKKGYEPQVLAPAYGHIEHEGDLCVIKGKPTLEEGVLARSEITYGLLPESKLRRLVPA